MDIKNNNLEIILSILASFTGGFFDAFTYILHNQIFANTQTGNIIFFTIYLFEKNWMQVFLRFIPIIVFIFGIFLYNLINRFNKKNYIIICLIIQAILILVILFWGNILYSTIVCAIISFICSMQLVIFKKAKDIDYASIMCTGNLRSFSNNLSKGLIYKDKDALKKSGYYSIVILTFMLGVFLGMFFVNLFKNYAIAIIFVILILKIIAIAVYKNKIDNSY